MARLDNQITLADVDPHYQLFIDKFKPKKTTDDCYTPSNIYEVVLDWVVNEYGIDRENVVRPFWPNGDYMTYDYPDGCTVVDNPPFSISAEIVNNYNAAGIKYILFAPYLTNFTAREKTSHIITGTNITYENGADVPTAFLTNLDSYLLRSCPDLAKQIESRYPSTNIRITSSRRQIWDIWQNGGLTFASRQRTAFLFEHWIRRKRTANQFLAQVSCCLRRPPLRRPPLRRPPLRRRAQKNGNCRKAKSALLHHWEVTNEILQKLGRQPGSR